MSSQTTPNPLEENLTGYVSLSKLQRFNAGIGIGMYSRNDPDSIRRYRPKSVVTNVKRARQIAREIHEWDIADEDEIRKAQMEKI